MINDLSPNEFLRKAEFNKSIVNFCAKYYEMFLKNVSALKEKLINFILLMEWQLESEETFEIESIYTPEEYETPYNNALQIVKKIVDNLVTENLDKEVFYAQLLEKISDDVLFCDDLEKICALVVLILNPKIPYFKLGNAMRMENERYKEISDSIREDISKALFAVKRGYSQKTEIASQIYNIVKEIKGDEERVVLIANILGYYSYRIKKLADNAKKNKEKQDEQN